MGRMSAAYVGERYSGSEVKILADILEEFKRKHVTNLKEQFSFSSFAFS